MEIELVNSEGYSMGLYSNSEIIQREKDNGAVEVPIMISNFIKKKWDFSNNTWIEGATPEEILKKEAEKQNEYLEKLVFLVNDLDKRLLISSISKEEKDTEYLKNQSNRYLEKYKVAKKYIEYVPTVLNPVFVPLMSDEYWYNQIVSELNSTNQIQGASITLSQFMGLIVQYYEHGEFRNKRFQTALETFRAKTKDFIIVKNYAKADECMLLASSLPNAMSLEDLDNKLIELYAI